MPQTSGRYLFSLDGTGAARLIIGGRLVTGFGYADIGHDFDGSAELTAGHPVPITVDYSSKFAALGASLQLGWQSPDQSMISKAVVAARSSDVAVVFASDATGEGADRLDLALPGDQNQLIAAVAAANPRTVVVLNTGAAVLMPWIGRVAGVVEAWYPGQQDGAAIAAVLFGDVDPSGRLPETFPADGSQGPGSAPAAYPGNGTHVDYREGILVGYRYYDAAHQDPLFPFGYGLSYTTFSYTKPVGSSVAGGETVRTGVTNTGKRTGATVVEAYVRPRRTSFRREPQDIVPAPQVDRPQDIVPPAQIEYPQDIVPSAWIGHPIRARSRGVRRRVAQGGGPATSGRWERRRGGGGTGSNEPVGP